jgi:Prokaryotic glutathione synthetase, ATP-grasp domain.
VQKLHLIKRIGEKVGARLKSENILFAGIDIIDDKLTEINITSPTCAVEIFDQTGGKSDNKDF